ncbi:beta/alpha barrel domain-containing protein [Pseudomonas sp. ZS1P83]
MSIAIHDPTLRDGNHAVSHSLSLEDIASYCQAVDGCGLSVVEVGHGNGLGASSLQLGLARYKDSEMLETARANLTHSRLGIHMIPGFARLSDIDTALQIGVDVLRIASHCTEASLTESYIEHARAKGAYVQGVLMMTPAIAPGFLWVKVCASICCRQYLDITKAIGKSGIQSTNRA